MDVHKEVRRIARENGLTTEEVVRLFLLELKMGEQKDRIVYNRKTGRYHYTTEYDRVRHYH